MTITVLILIITCVISFMAFQNNELRNRFIFNPHIIHERRQWYRFISSGMIHADWIHLAVNMFVFYSFGKIVEEYFKEIFEERGVINFLLLYFGGMIFSILPTYKKNRNNYSYNALGASGAVSAIVFSFILFRPVERLCFYGILCLPGIIFGGLYLIYCYFASKRGGDYINHDAHLWGAVYGFLFPIAMQPRLFLYFMNQLPFFHPYV